MNAADISKHYAAYKRFTVSRQNAWKPQIHANLKQMILNATDEPTTQAAIRNLDANMLQPSGIALTIQNIYTDAGSVWGGHVYQMVKKQGDVAARHALQNGKKAMVNGQSAMVTKALMPIGYNEEMVAEIIAYFRLNLLNEAVLPISDTMKDWILQQVIRAQEEGRSIQQVADSMLKDDFPANRAIVIARTETIKAANFGAVQGAKKTGLLTEKLWIAARDHRTRRIPRDEFSHAAMHGVTAAMDQPFYVPNRNGGVDDIMQPGDPRTGEAANVIQCRCTVGFNVVRDANGMPVRLGEKPPFTIPPPKPVPPKPEPPKVKPPFKPAATIPEAEEWARKNLIRPEAAARVARNNEDDRYVKIVDVSYKGLKVDVANKINKQLSDEIEINGLPLLNRIQARPIKKQGWAARISQHGELELNTVTFKNLDRIPETEAMQEFVKVRPLLEQYQREGRLNSQQQAMLKRADEMVKYKSLSASENPLDILTHELGHHLDNNIFELAAKKGLSKDTVKAMIQDAMNETSKNEVNKYNLSYYAYSDVFAAREEIFAEAFTLYRTGKRNRLAPAFIKLFDTIIH